MQTALTDIGKRKGSLLVFGGVYSNLQALQALKDLAEKQSIPAENILCTGDVVAYCAQPEACVQLIKNWGIACIAGNVEIQLASGQEDCACDFISGGRCDTFSRQWYPFARKNLSNDSLEWMKALPPFIQLEYAEKNIVVVHGSFHYTSEYIFKSTDWAIKQKNLDDTKADVILAGHCGLPFSQKREHQYWLNPGVIGMPANDATPKVWYMLLDDRDNQLRYQHCSLDYDFELASHLMTENKLPLEYATTLKTGIWDNCEILPPEETIAQGKAIVF